MICHKKFVIVACHMIFILLIATVHDLMPNFENQTK